MNNTENKDSVMVYIQFPKKIIEEVEKLAEEDYSTKEIMIKKMVAMGLREYRKIKAAKLYKEGKISISGAARMCGMTVKRMGEYVSEKEFRMDYGILELEKELIL